MSTNDKVTDKNLDEFGKDIIKAAEMLQVATLSLRSLYVFNSSSVNSFVNLRQKITNQAKIYSKKVLPTSDDLIRSISKFFSFYSYADLDDFKDYFEVFVREVERGAEKCEITLKFNEQILVEFKKSEDEVIKVLKQLESKTKEYEKKKKELTNSANLKFNWASCLALIPVVNVIAGPIIYVKGRKSIVNAIAESEEELLTVAAAEAIKGPLIMSITTLISTFNNIAKFFIILTDEMNNIGDNNLKEAHFNKMIKQYQNIVDACDYYFSQTPDAIANLQAIPDDYDKNYVEEWRLEKS